MLQNGNCTSVLCVDGFGRSSWWFSGCYQQLSAFHVGWNILWGEDDVKFAGNRLDSVKERDLLFSTVALERYAIESFPKNAFFPARSDVDAVRFFLCSFEAISLQESPSSAASASDAGPETQTQTAASTDDASPNTLYSRNHSKVDAVHISLCAADIFSEVQWTAR
ncbi:hypothetical protein VaNZ11_015705 [Volvox africanus]|uniref:Uncharacterized protein n=1 Tax=Volvox africanus TaxID=51714 RepID=A0ABQ5SLF3_9CHLO|nr:hypothetical protein VaNZ11_015705 [Volvox africanus]